jgi:hypothetical protein
MLWLLNGNSETPIRCEMITQEYLKSVLSYDPHTGKWCWIQRPLCHFKTQRACSTWNSRFAGKPAGTVDKEGYVLIVVNYKSYKSHRLAWFYMTGNWPRHQIDHNNLDKGDNSWSNLREATTSENHGNISAQSNNKLGIKGVNYACGKFYARIKKNGKTFYLGCYDTKEEAQAKYQSKALELFGEYARS